MEIFGVTQGCVVVRAERVDGRSVASVTLSKKVGWCAIVGKCERYPVQRITLGLTSERCLHVVHKV